MKRTISALAILAVAVASQAITITHVSISGSGSGGATNDPLGSNGISYSLPDMFAVGAFDSRHVSIHYTVAASAGQYLTGFLVSPVGSVRDATATIRLDHVDGGTQTLSYFQSAGSSAQSIPGNGMGFTGMHSFFDVFVELDIQDAQAVSSFSKITIFDVTYTEAPVPEPATLTALGAGMALLARRRRSKER